jgi:hypothetical protein
LRKHEATPSADWPADRKRLELLCRYIMRPALSDKRMQLKPAPP